MHNGYQDRRRPDRLPHLIRVHDPIRIDTDKSRFVSVRGQEAGGLKHRVVLYLRGHKVSSLLLVREQGPEKGHVIRLASAGGEIYLCLLYTSDAADDLLCVDLGGRRIIKKKKKKKTIMKK